MPELNGHSSDRHAPNASRPRAVYSARNPDGPASLPGPSKTESTDQGIALTVKAVVVTDFGMVISYSVRRIGMAGKAPIVPAEIFVNDGSVGMARHIGVFQDASIGVITVETDEVGGLTLSIGAMIERLGPRGNRVVRGKWLLPIH